MSDATGRSIRGEIIPDVITGTPAADAQGDVVRVAYLPQATLESISGLTVTAFSASSAAEATLGPALSSGKTVYLYGLILIADSPVAVTLKDKTSGTALTGAMRIGSWCLPLTGRIYYQSQVSQALTLLLGSAVQVSGTAWTVQV